MSVKPCLWEVFLCNQMSCNLTPKNIKNIANRKNLRKKQGSDQ